MNSPSHLRALWPSFRMSKARLSPYFRASVAKSGLIEVLIWPPLRLEHPQPRVRLEVRDADSGDALQHVEIALLATGGAPVRATASPHYLDERGVHEIVLPAGVAALQVGSAGHEPTTVDASGLRDGDQRTVLLTASP